MAANVRASRSTTAVAIRGSMESCQRPYPEVPRKSTASAEFSQCCRTSTSKISISLNTVGTRSECFLTYFHSVQQ
jgi:hypothetical protein